MKKVKLSIVIVGVDLKEYLIPCLESIFKADFPFGIEVIYVDNGSTDGTIEILKNRYLEIKRGCLKIIENKENLGFTRANNQGAAIAGGKYLLFLNSDTVVIGEALKKMVEYMEEHPEIGVLGPKLYNSYKKDLQVSSTGKLTPLSALFAFSFLDKVFPKNRFSKNYFLSDWDRNSLKEVAAVSGAALMVRKDVFFKVGSFDERFFFYFEETDLCDLVRKAKFKVVYYPEAEIIHFGAKSAEKKAAEMKKIFFQSRHRYFLKHFGFFKGIIVDGLLKLFESFS